jgi:biofilm PGA synthesis lipoprotein PgaB
MFKYFIFLLLFASTFNSANACVVLLYHHFSDKTPPSTSISPTLFEKHLKYIKNNDFKVLSVKELINNLKNQKELPDKCVVLTVDDAYTSIATNAYPLLKKYQMPMSVFVATGEVDKKYKAFMTYKQMHKLKDYVAFYNHSTNHEYFSKFNKHQAKDSILKAQKTLKNKLGVADKIFAYPYGEYNLESYEMVKSLGFVAFGQHSGTIGLSSNINYLPRFPMNNLYGKMASFITKINTIAMPIIDKKPLSPIVKNNPPTWEITLKNKLNLNCFVGGQKIPNIIWDTSDDNITAKITAKEPLKTGRTKYNCTANSGEKTTDRKNRFYWISKQWVVK